MLCKIGTRKQYRAIPTNSRATRSLRDQRQRLRLPPVLSQRAGWARSTSPASRPERASGTVFNSFGGWDCITGLLNQPHPCRGFSTKDSQGIMVGHERLRLFFDVGVCNIAAAALFLLQLQGVLD